MLGWVLVGQWLRPAGPSREVPEFAGVERERGEVVLNLRWYRYPQLTLTGGVGKRVLGLAMDAAGYDVS
jgi:hypothetical protein